MASYNLFISRSAEKEILALPKKDRQKIVEKVRKLVSTPRPIGCEKLKGETAYRLRQGDYRIVYVIDDVVQSISIEKVGHRREVYR